MPGRSYPGLATNPICLSWHVWISIQISDTCKFVYTAFVHFRKYWYMDNQIPYQYGILNIIPRDLEYLTLLVKNLTGRDSMPRPTSGPHNDPARLSGFVAKIWNFTSDSCISRFSSEGFHNGACVPSQTSVTVIKNSVCRTSDNVVGSKANLRVGRSGRDIFLIFYGSVGWVVKLGCDWLTILEFKRVLLAFFLKSCEMSPYFLVFFIWLIKNL